MRPPRWAIMVMYGSLAVGAVLTLTDSSSQSQMSLTRPLLFSMTSAHGAIVRPAVTTTTVSPSPPVPPVVSPILPPRVDHVGTSTTVPYVPSTTSPASVSTSAGLDPTVYAEWTRVAICEEGGWIGYAGSAYPDSLGINAANWAAWGGGSDESPANQIRVAQDIEAAAGNPGFVPDQNGCASW